MHRLVCDNRGDIPGKLTDRVLRLLQYPRTSQNMQAYEAPQAAVEEEQEGPQSFATPIEKLQARQNELRYSAANALHAD